MWMMWIGGALASPWVEPWGTVRVGVQGTSLDSRQQFAGGEALGFTGPRCPEPVFAGQRMPYSCVTGGRYVQRSLTAFGQIGVGRGVAVDLQIPVVAASFSDDIGRTDALGVGDLRFGARVGRGFDRFSVAAAFHVKAPTGPGDFQDRDVPLGDGQWDLSPGVRAGVSLYPFGWAEVWQTFRIRLPNPETGIDSGDESITTLAAAWTPIQPLGLLARVEGLIALPDRDGFGLPAPGRRLLLTQVSLFARPIPALWIELGAAIPVAGRRWPAAVQPSLTVMWTFQPH